VGNRAAGMSWKVVKYHAIMHMSNDIINFGVPMNFDTGSDESGHKPSKAAAKLTQKRTETFDAQVNKRLIEVHLLELATEEITKGRSIDGYANPPASAKIGRNQSQSMEDQGPTKLGGAKFVAIVGDDGKKFLLETGKPPGKGARKCEVSFIDFVAALAEKVKDQIPNLELNTTWTKTGQIYRGAPWYNGGVWRDWVMVDWGEPHGLLPNKIWGYVDLRDLPQDNTISCSNLVGNVPPKIYAIVESAKVDPPPARNSGDTTWRSELFTPITKEVGAIRDGIVTDMKLYLADVDAFSCPVTVVPDIGGRPNAYFMVESRTQWGENFVKWLRRRHEDFPDFEEET